MKKGRNQLLFCFLFLSITLFGQDKPYSYSLTELNIAGRVLEFNDLGNQISFQSENGEHKIYDFDRKEVLDPDILKNMQFTRKSSSDLEVGSNFDLTAIELIDEYGNKKKISPLGYKNYLNVSLSKEKDRILFRVSGIGSYIADLDGNIIAEFKDAEFPSWAGNNEIMYAVISDNGHQFISSDLYIHNLESNQRQNITEETDQICLFPSINIDKSKVVFSTPSDRIFLLKMTK